MCVCCIMLHLLLLLEGANVLGHLKKPSTIISSWLTSLLFSSLPCKIFKKTMMPSLVSLSLTHSLKLIGWGKEKVKERTMRACGDPIFAFAFPSIHVSVNRSGPLILKHRIFRKIKIRAKILAKNFPFWKSFLMLFKIERPIQKGRSLRLFKSCPFSFSHGKRPSHAKLFAESSHLSHEHGAEEEFAKGLASNNSNKEMMMWVCVWMAPCRVFSQKNFQQVGAGSFLFHLQFKYLRSLFFLSMKVSDEAFLSLSHTHTHNLLYFSFLFSIE